MIKVTEICSMHNSNWYNLNGKFFLETENHLSINNRSLRYGDGFFETMKLQHGIIRLFQLHAERIENSLQLLKLQLPKHFSFEKLEEQIITTAQKNQHQPLARIRVMFFRAEGEIFDANNHQVQIMIQSFELSDVFNELNKNGLVIDVFRDAKKSYDVFSNLKTNNYLPYIMGAIWAKENHLNDALILNTNEFIADSCIANVFLVKDENIITPSLQSGCVAGVMRKHVMQQLQQNNITVVEKNISIEDIINADEVFLTNAIKGITWVKQCGNKTYQNSKTQELYQLIFAT